MNSLTRSESMQVESIVHDEIVHDEIVQGMYEKKKVMVPPMQYDLRFAAAHMAYNHIAELTKNDLGATNYLAQIKPEFDELQYNQKPIVFGYIPEPPHTDVTRQVIGLKGYFFKKTTTCCGVYFIWHDTAHNSFLFWGPSKFKVVKAMNSIRWRIFKFYEERSSKYRRSAAPEPISEDEDDDEDEYADMPGLIPADEAQDLMPKQISMGQEPDYEHPEQC